MNLVRGEPDKKIGVRNFASLLLGIYIDTIMSHPKIFVFGYE
jgi:hypothetical protein